MLIFFTLHHVTMKIIIENRIIAPRGNSMVRTTPYKANVISSNPSFPSCVDMSKKKKKKKIIIKGI